MPRVGRKIEHCRQSFARPTCAENENLTITLSNPNVIVLLLKFGMRCTTLRTAMATGAPPHDNVQGYSRTSRKPKTLPFHLLLLIHSRLSFPGQYFPSIVVPRSEYGCFFLRFDSSPSTEACVSWTLCQFTGPSSGQPHSSCPHHQADRRMLA